MRFAREGTPGPKAFAFLTAKLNLEFDTGDFATALALIQSFVVPVGTSLKRISPNTKIWSPAQCKVIRATSRNRIHSFTPFRKACGPNIPQQWLLPE